MPPIAYATALAETLTAVDRRHGTDVTRFKVQFQTQTREVLTNQHTQSAIDHADNLLVETV